MLRNSANSWGWISRLLHWLMAALILVQITLGKYAHGLSISPQKLDLMMWHKSLGITLLLLALVRLAWTLSNPRPLSVTGAGFWLRSTARFSHLTLYTLMFAIPLSGWLMNSAKNFPFSFYRVFPLPSLIGPDEAMGKLFQAWHDGLVTALLVLLAAHVSAAFWHHLYQRDAVLLQMLGKERNS